MLRIAPLKPSVACSDFDPSFESTSKTCPYWECRRDADSGTAPLVVLIDAASAYIGRPASLASANCWAPRLRSVTPDCPTPRAQLRSRRKDRAIPNRRVIPREPRQARAAPKSSSKTVIPGSLVGRGLEAPTQLVGTSFTSTR